MEYCLNPKYKDLVNSWNDYYPNTPDKCRLGLHLAYPKPIIISKVALHHDFYYYGDEFTVLFDPIDIDKENAFLLVEGAHLNPSGQRIPLLSTWSHIKRARHGERGTQYLYAFYKNLWWEVADTTYTYDDNQSISTTPYMDLTWCKCSDRVEIFYNSMPHDNLDYTKDGKHSLYKRNSNVTTLSSTSNKKDEFVWDLLNQYRNSYNESYLNGNSYNIDYLKVIGDYLYDKDDPFGEYIQTQIMKPAMYNIPKYYLAELKHKLEYISFYENDRAAKLILLAEILIRNSYHTRGY